MDKGEKAPDPAPRTLVLVLGHPVARTEVPRLCARVRALLEGIGPDRVMCDVGRLTDPDLVTVETLARLQLAARRRGCTLRLVRASAELRELLVLAGLHEVVPSCD